ncbi:MAG TPA: DUF5615 family PIN-like protein [Planctomycetaceae bacterium]|jgi:predicted nuclease of predicted toxin-antitoxin system
MKFLLDQGLPRSTVKHLSDLRIVAEHVGNLGMASATDAEILAAAQKRDDVVVTLDADFHRLLADSRAMSPSVVRVRIEGLRGDELAKLLLQVVADAGPELVYGAAISVTETRIRIRTLPIGA